MKGGETLLDSDTDFADSYLETSEDLLFYNVLFLVSYPRLTMAFYTGIVFVYSVTFKSLVEQPPVILSKECATWDRQLRIGFCRQP